MIRQLLLCASLLAAAALHAQNATISRFRFNTADTAYSLWSDTTTVCTFKLPGGRTRTVNTADTLFHHTRAVLNKRLGITLNDQVRDTMPVERSKETLMGFPNDKMKAVLADGLFGYIIEVQVDAYKMNNVIKGGSRNHTEPGLDLIVTVETHDGSGKQTGKYKARTASKDIKRRENWLKGYDPKIGVTGIQLMDLYIEALENAMNDTR